MRQDLSEVPWDDLDGYQDRTVFQTLPWLEYLMEIGAGQPIVASLVDANATIGWFTGIRHRVAGIPVLSSPAAGWNTAYMGLNLDLGVSREAALLALREFAFTETRTIFLEVRDVVCDEASAIAAGYTTEVTHGYVTDLSQSEDELLRAMKSATRGCLNKAAKFGIAAEEASPEGFAAEFHSQVASVFAHQGLDAPYTVERVQTLIDKVHASGDLLLLRVRNPDGESISTGIFVGHGNYSTFWGNGSVRSELHHRPNQVLHWAAMRRLKSKGVRFHDWGGSGKYKASYGPAQLAYATSYVTRVPGLVAARGRALGAFYRARDLRGHLRRRSPT